MRILHILAALEGQAAVAASRLMTHQRREGHVVAAASLPAFGDQPGDGSGLTQFVTNILGGAERFDLIHTHGTAAVPVTLALEPAGVERTPVVVTLHDWLGEDGVRAARVHIEALNRADLVTAPSAMAAARVTTLGVDSFRVRVIPYAVEAAPAMSAAELEFEREIVAWRMKGGDVLCAIGYNPQGSHHEAVLTAVSYVAHRDALLCVLAGQVDAGACRRQARDLGISDRVRVCDPAISPRTIASRCDYVALPSFDERRPFTLAEAWCDGVPVLAGRNTQFSGMDARGHGTVFFDAGDPYDLARAIATVRSTTPAGRRLLIERARHEYRRHFTPDAVYAAYGNEYRSLLNQMSAQRAAKAAAEESAS